MKSDQEERDERGARGSLLTLGRALEEERNRTRSILEAAPEISAAERHAEARASRAAEARTAELRSAELAAMQAALVEAQAETEAARVGGPAGDPAAPQAMPGLIERVWKRKARPAAQSAPPLSEPPKDEKSALERIENMLARQEAEIDAARLASSQAAADAARAASSARTTDAFVAARMRELSPRQVAFDDGGATASYDQRKADGRTNEQEELWKPLIDPFRVIRGIIDARALIVLLTLLGALAGVFMALSTPKKYEAIAELLIDPRDLKIVDRGLTDINGLPSDSTIAIVENQMRVLTSGTVLNKVVEQLNLESDPEFNGTAGGLSLNPITIVRSLLTRSDGTTDPGRRRAIVISNLADGLSVARAGKTFIVLVSMKTKDADKSALIANTVVDVFVKTSGEMQSDQFGRANDELMGRLEVLRKEVEAAEQKVEKFKAENDLVDAQGRLITDDEIIKLNDQLSVARARTLELNARATSARAVDPDAAIGGALPEGAQSSVMTGLRAQYASARQEADQLSVRLGPRHPSYQSAQAQVSAVRGQIAAELTRIVSQIQTELKRSVQLEQDLAARLAQLKVRQGDLSNGQVALRELERDAQAKRQVYESFLLRAQETSEQKGINSANISVISQAFPPLDPTGGSRVTTVITGALLGLLSGLAIGGLMGIIGSLRDSARESRAGRRARADRLADLPEPLPAPDPGEASTIKDRIAALMRRAKPNADVKTKPAAVESDKDASMTYPPRAPGYAPYPQAAAEAPVHPHSAYPVYPQPAHPGYAPLTYVQPPPYAPMYQQPAPGGYPPYPPQAPAYGQPMPPAYQAQPQRYPVYPRDDERAYGAAVPVHPGYAPQSPYPPSARPAEHHWAEAPQHPQRQSPETIAEITESLREFRYAVRELMESRTRRRYF